MQHGDEERFKAELISFIPRLRAFGRTLTGTHAAGEDLAQEAVLRAWRGREGFTPGSNMEAWLFRILRNLHLTGLRRNRRSPMTAADERVELVAGVDDPAAGLELNDLRRALNRLPSEQREALILVGASGWSYEEAAAHAGCPLGTMKSRVFRARRTLASNIETGQVVRDAAPAPEALAGMMVLVDAAQAAAPSEARAAEA